VGGDWIEGEMIFFVVFLVRRWVAGVGECWCCIKGG
jgi:hypothetical protein